VTATHANRESGIWPSLRGGYTVLDLLVALAIMGVLLTLAIPSYQRHVQRGHRAEAVRILLATAACEEQLRAGSGFYDTSRCVDAPGTEYYAIRIDPPGETVATEFTVLAVPLQAWADDLCGTLSLDQAGTRGISGEASALAGCWAGR